MQRLPEQKPDITRYSKVLTENLSCDSYGLRFKSSPVIGFSNVFSSTQFSGVPSCNWTVFIPSKQRFLRLAHAHCLSSYRRISDAEPFFYTGPHGVQPRRTPTKCRPASRPLILRVVRREDCVSPVSWAWRSDRVRVRKQVGQPSFLQRAGHSLDIAVNNFCGKG